jgi:hypothetical protein
MVPAAHRPKIWVQIWAQFSLLRAPSALFTLLGITEDSAEVLCFPLAAHSAGCGDSARKLQPTGVKRSLDHLRRESHFPEEGALRGPCFIAVALRVEVERRLDARMTQERLHGLGLNLRLVDKPA